jgi:hypothetical protein
MLSSPPTTPTHTPARRGVVDNRDLLSQAIAEMDEGNYITVDETVEVVTQVRSTIWESLHLYLIGEGITVEVSS